MTPEQQRIAIAEACGWARKTMPAGEIEWLGPPPEREYFGRYSPSTTPSALPDYLNDLNAMHEAEERMLNDPARRGWRAAYGNELAKVVSANGDGTWLDDFRMIRATAAQRAEAFLRTLNLWKDDDTFKRS